MAIDYRKVQQLRLEQIGSVTGTYNATLAKVARDLERRMLVLIGQYSTGQVSGALGDVALARAQVQQILIDSGYFKATGDLLSTGYQSIVNENLRIYDKYYSKALQFNDVSSARLNAIRVQHGQVFQDLGGKAATNLQQILTDLSFGNSTIESASQALSKTIDMSAAQAETVVRTSVHAFERQASSEMATAAGIDEFIYIGPDDKLTRKFCDTYLEKVKKWEEWQKIINPDDPMGPITVYGGGHNCRHELVPYIPD